MAYDMMNQQGTQSPYGLPKLPSLQDYIAQNTNNMRDGSPVASTANVFKLLQAPTARMTDALPGLQELLMGTQAPAVQAIREGARSNRASAQSDAMKRGLTGSDIEAANMTAATSQGEQAVGQLVAQQSSALAQYIMQALGLDIQANREQFLTLAQAIGQEYAALRDIEQNRLDREAGIAAGQRNAKYALLGSGIQAGGNIIGGAMRMGA